MPSLFEERAAEFWRADKVLLRRPRWRTKGHPDYAELNARAHPADRPALYGNLVITAHTLREPPKYSFNLLFGGVRLLSLDANPSRIHRNKNPKRIVNTTHWHYWNEHDARPDDRNLLFAQWLDEFLRAANIRATKLRPPPFGRQLDLGL